MKELSASTKTAREIAVQAASKCLKASLSATIAQVNSDSSLRFADDSALDEVLRVLRNLMELERTNSIVVRFAIGDVWNFLACHETSYGKRAGIMRRMLGDGKTFERECTRFRQYGWVCTKWPANRRRFDRSWSWFVNNKPDFGTKSSIITPPSTPRAIAANYMYSTTPGVALDVQIDLQGYTVHLTDTAGEPIDIVISMQNANKAWRSEVRLSEGAKLELQEAHAA